MRPSRARRLVRAAIAVATAIVLSVLGSIGGLTYLWCAPMAEARLHCCCPDEEPSGHAELRVACCEPRVVAELGSRTQHDEAPRGVAPAALDLTWLAAIDPSVLRFGREPSHASDHGSTARAGPRRHVHRDCSVYLL